MRCRRRRRQPAVKNLRLESVDAVSIGRKLIEKVHRLRITGWLQRKRHLQKAAQTLEERLFVPFGVT